jgi:hypothetical protein
MFRPYNGGPTRPDPTRPEPYRPKRWVVVMLDLEIIGETRDLGPTEVDVTNVPVSLKRLRDSHHSVARLVAAGLSNIQISLQTGYAPARVSILRADPTFIELVQFYRNNADAVRMTFEHRMLLAAEDFVQHLHETLHDTPEAFTPETALDAVKILADRAGFAPINRSITKSVTYNVGDRMDAARARLKRDGS